jgi:hypothetical protein
MDKPAISNKTKPPVSRTHCGGQKGLFPLPHHIRYVLIETSMKPTALHYLYPMVTHPLQTSGLSPPPRTTNMSSLYTSQCPLVANHWQGKSV